MYTATQNYTPCLKNIPDIIDCNLKNRLSKFNNFWYEYSRHNWPSNDRLISHFTQRLLLHYRLTKKMILFTS